MSSTASPARRSRGRPPSSTAESHALILDAVYDLLQERSVRDLTIEAVAKRAKVSKPTIYKWWPTKADLVMAMLQERLDHPPDTPQLEVASMTVQDSLKLKVRMLVGMFNGMFGKVMAELIAEGQSDPAVLKTLYDRHLRERRAATVAEVERARVSGELPAEIDPELVVDTISGPLYYRLLLRQKPLTEAYADDLVAHAFRC
ncbi:MAG: TetR/AcrR family transcriptional regulator [Mycobacterium sp.]